VRLHALRASDITLPRLTYSEHADHGTSREELQDKRHGQVLRALVFNSRLNILRTNHMLLQGPSVSHSRNGSKANEIPDAAQPSLLNKKLREIIPFPFADSKPVTFRGHGIVVV
jgi:hypothetical protein